MNWYFSIPIVLVLLYAFGIQNIFISAISVVGFIFGFTFFENYETPFFLKRYSCKLEKGIPKIIENMKDDSAEKVEFNFSDNKELNKSLSEFMDLVLKDYIDIWYQYISSDTQFLNNIRQSLNHIIRNICSRCKKIDWLPVLTEDLPNEVGTHIKLYRLSNQYCNRSKDRNLHNEFFNLEAQSYKVICRQKICTEPNSEKDYLRKISELILYILCPSSDFNVPPIRYLLRECLVNAIFIPTLDMISDPDFINQYIIWMTKDSAYTSEYFIQSIRMSTSFDEINAVKSRIDLFNQRLRSRDSGGDDDAFIKAQLGSLDYLKKICDTQIKKLDKSGELDDIFSGNFSSLNTEKLALIGLDFIMEHQIGISLFLEFLLTIGGQDYLKTYTNIIEYKSRFMQMSGVNSGNSHWSESDSHEVVAGDEDDQLDIFSNCGTYSSTNHNAAGTVFTSTNNNASNNNNITNTTTIESNIDPKLFSRKILCDCKKLSGISEEAVTMLQQQIDYDNLAPGIFDNVMRQIHDQLCDKRYLDAFKSSRYFQQFLVEIDFLRDDSQISEEELLLSSNELPNTKSEQNLVGSALSGVSNWDSDSYSIRIVDSEKIKKDNFVQYTIVIIKTDKYGSKDTWRTFRRYRDFDSLNSLIIDVIGKNNVLKMPTKKPFNNMSSEFLEKRIIDLQDYINSCIAIKHPEVRNLVVNFIQKDSWNPKNKALSSSITSLNSNSITSNSNSGGAISSFVSPLRNMGQAVMNVPDNVSRLYSATVGSTTNTIKSQATIGNNFYSINNSSSGQLLSNSNNIWGPMMSSATGAVGDFTDYQDDQVSRFNDSVDQGNKADNIPIRIMLLMVDEIFDLHNKSQVVRRSVLGILRKIVKTFFGDKVNKIILLKAAVLTSANQAAELINKLKESMWPSSKSRSQSVHERDAATRLRTRVLCRAVMLGSVSEEVSQLLGNETTRQGVVRVFDLCQDRTLNRRLAHSILYSVLMKLLPGHNLDRLMEMCLCPALQTSSTVIGDVNTNQRVCDKHQMTPPTWPDWSSDSSSNTSSFDLHI